MRQSWLLLLLPGLLQAQAAVQVPVQSVVGRLVYTTAAGRALSFQIIEAGPGRITLAPEKGDAARVRAFILAHAGEEARVAKGSRPLADPVPMAWRGGSGSAVLLRNHEATFWRPVPGQVVPAQFSFAGQAWQLLAAELPPESLVGRSF